MASRRSPAGNGTSTHPIRWNAMVLPALVGRASGGGPSSRAQPIGAAGGAITAAPGGVRLSTLFATERTSAAVPDREAHRRSVRGCWSSGQAVAELLDQPL